MGVGGRLRTPYPEVGLEIALGCVVESCLRDDLRRLEKATILSLGLEKTDRTFCAAAMDGFDGENMEWISRSRKKDVVIKGS